MNDAPLIKASRFVHSHDDFGFIALDIRWMYPEDSGKTLVLEVYTLVIDDSLFRRLYVDRSQFGW